MRRSALRRQIDLCARRIGSPITTQAVQLAAAISVAAALGGCASGPAYVAPKIDLPARWSTEAPWREGRPTDAEPKGPWWQRFNDPALDALQQQALAGSPNLLLANARLAQSRAVLAGTAAAVLPQIGLGERLARQRISANRPLTNYASSNFSTVQNDFSVAMSVNYELDLAGRVASSVQGASASAEQVRADVENIRLLLATDLATAYFNLRAVDAELDVVRRAIALQRRALDLVIARRELGAATGLDVAQQQALLDTTLVQIDLLQRQRGLFEHAVASLVGVPAPGFILAADLRDTVPPEVPIGVPSDVLERRPDVASAERAMAAANAQIGVAQAAFYPAIVLGGSLGVDSRSLASLLDAPSLLWSLGASAAQVLFDGGRLQANIEFSRAGYDATVAGYRRTVLQAMQEVEDGITGLAALERASTQARSAVASAAKVLDLASARYDGGVATYFEVISAQQALLGAERQATQLRGQRLLTVVFLIKALGGDWPGLKAQAQGPASIRSGAS
jgi:NodT family efflux transporter outer membrane factor (OMF) lipoprotein